MIPANESSPFPIGNIPDEILLEIFNYIVPLRGLHASEEDEATRRIENAKRIQSLHSLTISCRHLHNLVQPILYQTFIQPEIDTGSARLLMRTLLDRPDLSQHIQYIETVYTEICPPSKPPRNTSVSPNKPLEYDEAVHLRWELFHQHFSRAKWQPSLQGSKPFDWFHYDYMFGCAWVHEKVEGYVAFIMLLSPNLSQVAISSLHSLYIITLASRAYKDIHGLRNLWLRQRLRSRDPSVPHRVLSVTGQAIRVAFPLSESLTLLNAYSYLFPAMYDDVPNAWFWGPHPHGLLDLVLDACEISSTDLAKILSKRMSLRRFTCNWGIKISGTADLFPQPINLPALNAALSSSQGTLEYLTLNTLDSGWKIEQNQPLSPIGSLRRFTALKHLDVSRPVLWLDRKDHPGQVSVSNLLPQALESLAINESQGAYIERFLLELIKDCEVLLPHLKTISSRVLMTDFTSVKELAEQFNEIGVRLQVHVMERH